MPSNIVTSPWPPASTTPASRSTANKLGVLRTLSQPAATVTLHMSTNCRSVSFSALAAMSLITVSMVPSTAVSYTHLRAHETDSYLVCRLLLEKKKQKKYKHNNI